MRNKNRLSRIDDLKIMINETEGKLKGYTDELKRLEDEMVQDTRRLRGVVELAGYIVIDLERDEYDCLHLCLSKSTRFKTSNIHAVQRKLKRLNLNFKFYKLEKDSDGRYARDENGQYTQMVEWFSVDWCNYMKPQDIRHQVIELGIELPPMSNEKIRSLRLAAAT